MTGRIAAMSIDGTPISDADVARMHAEEELHEKWQRRTVRVVASASRDSEDCRLLLSILGLDPSVVAAARDELARKPARKRGVAAA
ncbi:MAG: hypothetical protein ACR2LF_02360 [Jatrophihabitantaceae bacterium]